MEWNGYGLGYIYTLYPTYNTLFCTYIYVHRLLSQSNIITLHFFSSIKMI